MPRDLGTAIIFVVGYGLSLLLAYEWLRFGIRVLFTDGLDRPGSGGRCLFAAALCIAIALLTRRLIGGGCA